MNDDPDVPSLQQRFMMLPLIGRRRRMAEQAAQMAAHYEQTAAERQDWQAGDFRLGPTTPCRDRENR